MFQNTKLIFLLPLTGIIFLVVLAVAIIYTQIKPPLSPCACNVPTSIPVNVGPQVQKKEGGLILNTAGAATGLIVATGNVGIGTTEQTARLHISDPTFRGNIKLLTTSGVGHDFGYDGGLDSAFWFTHTGAVDGYTLFRWDNGISLSKDLLYINNNGNVGIGTTNPEAELDVNGTIRATDVCTTAGFCLSQLQPE